MVTVRYVRRRIIDQDDRDAVCPCGHDGRLSASLHRRNRIEESEHKMCWFLLFAVKGGCSHFTEHRIIHVLPLDSLTLKEIAH